MVIKPYPINVNGTIKILEIFLKEDCTQEQRQYLKGFLALFYSLKEQGIETTNSSKIPLKELINNLGMEWSTRGEKKAVQE